MSVYSMSADGMIFMSTEEITETAEHSSAAEEQKENRRDLITLLVFAGVHIILGILLCM